MNTNHFDSQAGLRPERGGTILGFVTIIGFFMVGGLFGVTSDVSPTYYFADDVSDPGRCINCIVPALQ